MDASLPYIHAPEAWAALGGVAQAGAGIKVAVVDTGIRPENPLFDGAGYTYPADGGPWPKGYCADHPDFCTGKLIAARAYAPDFPLPNGEVDTPLDKHGHGSHTAGSAVGNWGVQVPMGVFTSTIGGVAPRAWLMVYKGLVSDGEGGAVGTSSMLVAALEDAVRDGADVISNSWGYGEPGDPTEFPEAQAAENAVAAGVVVVFAAGNEGAVPGTLTPPGNTPGVITVGATTSPRTFEADVRLTADGAEPLQVTGASLGHGATGRLVAAEGVADAAGDTSGHAAHPYPPGTFDGDIVLVKRGGVARVTKSANVAAGGAVGMLLYNVEEGQDVVADRHTVPTVHIGYEEGVQVKAYLAAHEVVTATLSASAPAPAQPDVVAGFSSRGPNWDPEVVKPDVVAPGVNILSGNSPDSPIDPGAFTLMSGTSMATPQVAGAAALVRQRFPRFTPAQVKSALMTTAVTAGLTHEDGVTPAGVNERGAGRIDVAAALDPGLAFDTPSVGIHAVLGRAQRVVTATNVAATSSTYTVRGTNDPAGLRLSVIPATFTLAPGAAITLTLGVDLVGAPVGDYTAGQVTFTEMNGPHQAHLVTWLHAAPSAFPTRIVFEARTSAGERPFPLTPNADIASLGVTTFGPVPAEVRRVSIGEDEDHDPSTDPLDPAHGWRVFPLTLDAAVAWLAVRTSNAASTLADVDVYLLHDANGDGQFDWATERVAESRALGVTDEVQVEAPAAGRYAIAVHAYRGQGDFDLRTWTLRAGPDDSSSDRLQIIPPTGVLQAGVRATPRLRWAGVTQPGETYYGLARLANGGQSLGPSVLVAIERLAEQELTKTASAATVMTNQPVTYTVSVTNFDRQATTYALTDQLPPGLELLPGSLQGATYDPATRTVQRTFDLRGAREVVEFQDEPIGPAARLAYIDLPTELGTAPLSQGADGDDVGLDWDLPPGLPPFPYFGQDYTRFGLVSNGYLVLGGLQGQTDIQFRNTRLPDPARPNGVLAPFWTDLALSRNRLGHGEWYADVVTGGPFGANHTVVVQWQEVAHRRVRDSRFSFEVVLVLETGEVYYLYDTLTGQVDRVTVGAEDGEGTRGNTWYFDGAPADHAPTSHHLLALDIQPTAERYAHHTLTYQARPTVSGVITNTVAVDKGGAAERVLASAAVTVKSYQVFLPLVRR